ncbi:MAG: amino acid permease [Chlamydiae bacterium]|nr:amino acid permease [Chlamydiota bacterium]
MSNKKIPLFSLVLLIVAAIDSIKNLPASALFGSELIFFFFFSALLFLGPTSLVAAELSATFSDKGGVYHWIEKAFGEKWALVAIWMQWINTMVWYPTILSFIAGTFAYLLNPQLAENTSFLLLIILAVFWVITFINLRGVHTSARINYICALLGTVLPLFCLIICAIAWILKGNPLQIKFDKQSLVPSLSHKGNWVSLIAMMASFLGMELSGVHVNDIKNPQKNFPKAVLYASSFILLSMTLGSLAIAMIIPEEEINLVAGVMQVFNLMFNSFGLSFLIPIMTILIVIGSVGNITSWLISPAKGLLHAAEYGFLPPFFSKKNKNGVAVRILISQAIIVSAFCLLLFYIPSINGFFWFLTALSTELYMIMYVLMFLAAVKLHYKYIDRPKVFKIPGNNIGMWTTAIVGLCGCFATIAVSFLPPDNVDIGSSTKYVTMICVGNLITISPIFLFYVYKKRNAIDYKTNG